MKTRTKTAACRGKMRHPDHRSAAEHRDRLIKQQGISADRLRVYPCGHCGSYHVGHFVPSERRR